MLKSPFRGRSIKYMYVCMYVTKLKTKFDLSMEETAQFGRLHQLKGN